jgi:kojibiose phosphorylase
MQARTPESGIRVGYAWTTLLDGRPVTEPVGVRLRKGRTVCVTRIVSAASSVDIVPPADLRRTCERGLASAVRRGVPPLLADHERAWDRLWDVSDVRIPGAPKLEHAARFSIYHLLACGTAWGTPAGIAAKSLSGEGYRGHSFWDTEIYTLPFYSFSQPAMARQLVRYRLDRLEAAKRSAKARGLRGALFPWESGRTGGDVTPYFPLGDGSLYLFDTGKYQHHITADVAYGLMTYWTVTGDDSVMKAGGLELLAETARFWASRVVFNKRTGRYEIKGAMGPDEYHPDVDNSVYTNFLARWNLEYAATMLAAFSTRDAVKGELLFARLRLTGAELAEWRYVASRIEKTNPGKTGIIEQFDGYFKRKDVPVTKRNEHGMPAWPKGVKEDDAFKTQLNKQADVVLTMLMFPDRFTAEQKRKNFEYYDRRTLHISTLSACMTALAGLEFGIPKYSMRYFTPSLFTDLNDVRGDGDKGIHTASCGGNWQCLIRGFGGVAFRDGRLSISPRVPKAWKSIRYALRWRGAILRIDARPGSVTIRNEGKAAVDAVLFGKPAALKPGRSLRVSAPGA